MVIVVGPRFSVIGVTISSMVGLNIEIGGRTCIQKHAGYGESNQMLTRSNFVRPTRLVELISLKFRMLDKKRVDPLSDGIIQVIAQVVLLPKPA